MMSPSASAENNAHIRLLADHMLDGYAYCRMHFKDGVPFDFTYLDVNPAFEQLTGLKNVVGKKVSEVIPGLSKSNPELFSIYGRVALTGKPERFETYLPNLGIWFSVSVYCPEHEYFIATFDNITERKLQEFQIHRMHALVLAIRRINEYLLVAKEESSLFDFICNTLKELEMVDEVWIGIKESGDGITPVAWAGIDKEYSQDLPARWHESKEGNGPIQNATRELRPIVYEDAPNDKRLAWCSEIENLHIKSGVIIPLIIEEGVLGAIAIWSKSPAAFDEEVVKFLQEVSGDITFGLRSLQMDKKLKATLSSITQSLEGTITAIANMVELRDPYTAGHERHVSRLAEAIGKEMGLPERQVEGLRVAGFIHDIGKISVPAEILSKPTRLSEIEYSLVKTHAQSGFNILKGIDFPWPVAQAVLQHHERLDGSGYPQGLKGDEILPEARILAVADVVEAIHSHRPYRPGLGIHAALEEIERHRNVFYCSDVVDSCVRLFRNKGYIIQI